MDALNTFLKFELIRLDNYSLTVNNLTNVLIVFIVTFGLLWIIKKRLYKNRHLGSLDTGNSYAIFQIIKYFIWVVSISLILESIGIKITFLLAGSAALLVGVGLGLQQTFNDILSGIILLVERTIKVDDILEIDNDVIKIQQIGLRTSTGFNRNDISIILPNSMITSNKVINWSHQTKRTRFKITIGVAYGSNVDLVVDVLEKSVSEHDQILNKELIEVRFKDFNNSSLDFEVLFYCANIFRIERIKSDIRKNINKKFIENEIKIPFPQMDLHLKSNVAGIKNS